MSLGTAEPGTTTRIVEKNDDFNYSERDVLQELVRGLNDALRDYTLAETPGDKVAVTMVRAYGEAFESSRKAPKYNGQTDKRLIYSIRLEVSWYGRARLGETTLGSATGKIKVGEVDETNLRDPASWEMTTKLDIECIPGMPQQQPDHPPPVEPSEIEARLKALASSMGCAALRDALPRALERLLAREGEADKSDSDPTSSPELCENEKPAADPSRPLVDYSDLRRQLLGSEYLRVVDTGAKGETEWKLRLCTIHDRDMEQLCTRIADNGALRSLDLYFNYIGDAGLGQLAEAIKGLPALEALVLKSNKVGDAGVQQLMAMLAVGGAPRLALVDLTANPGITSTGKTIVKGLALMRKETAILLD